MKKTTRALLLVAATGILAAGSAVAVSAAQAGEGEWSTGSGGYWYKLNADGSSYASDGWYYIQGSDGSIACYYFDSDGWLLTSTARDGNLVNADGAYTSGGEVVTYSEDEVSYYVSTTFASEAASEQASSGSGSSSSGSIEVIELIDTTQSTSSGSSDTSSSGESTGSSSSSSSGSSSVFTGIKSGGAYSEEDDPANAKATIDFTYSKIVNKSVSSAWANYQITLPGIPTQGDGDNCDWYYESEDNGLIVCLYYPINKYGSDDLSGFIEGFTDDERGFAPQLKGGSVTNAGTVSLGGIDWVELTRVDPSPISTYTDECYLRVVNGMVQIIMLDYNGSGAVWTSVPTSIKTVY